MTVVWLTMTPDSSIYMEDGILEIKDFQTEDPDIVNFFEDIPESDHADQLSLALRVGVQSLRAAETIKNIDYIERRFERLHESVDAQLEDFFGDDGRLASDIFDPHSEDSPLYILRQSIEEEFNQLYKELGISEGEERVQQRTTEKGDIFQKRLGGVLGKIVANSEDKLKETGEEIGDIEGRFVGDFVIELENYPARIVIEAKNQKKTLPKIEEEMEEARANRNAGYSVYFARHVGQLPDKVGWFKEYTNNLLVVAVAREPEDPIDEKIVRIAYRWARMQILQQHIDISDEFSPGVIQDQVDAARRTASRFSDIKGECTTAANAVEQIEGYVEEMEESLENQLGAIERELRSAAD